MSDSLKDLMKSALLDYEAAGVDGSEGARAMRDGLARIEELETKLKAKEKLVLALAGDKIDLVSELAGVKGKLTKAVGFIEDLTGCEWPYCEDAKRVLAELSSVSCANTKGQDDE